MAPRPLSRGSLSAGWPGPCSAPTLTSSLLGLTPGSMRPRNRGHKSPSASIDTPQPRGQPRGLCARRQSSPAAEQRGRQRQRRPTQSRALRVQWSPRTATMPEPSHTLPTEALSTHAPWHSAHAPRSRRLTSDQPRLIHPSTWRGPRRADVDA